MNQLKKRIKVLTTVADRWLSNDNKYLMQAAGQTVEEGYFSEPDVKFALQTVKESINRKALECWAEQAGLTDTNDASTQNVLCLHAGNLPLVGFQNALAVLLSGARYTGKISRKDPYLLPTFLNEVKKTDIWNNMSVQWSHRLDDLEGMQNDAILFAGSAESVPEVKQAIDKYSLSKPDTRFLIRTAHFSMAYFDDQNEAVLKNLTTSILRYGGKGCRSVAVVVSPYKLSDIKDQFVEQAAQFLEKNPQHAKPPHRLKQQFAYNKAIGRSQLRLNHFLLQEGGLEFDQDFICCWVQGEEKKAGKLADQFGSKLQSIYTTQNNTVISGHQEQVEPLVKAQRPPIDWQPDCVDTLEFLI